MLSWILVDFSSQIVLGTKRCQKPLQVRFHDSPFQCSVHGVCGLASVCVFFSLLFAIIYLFCFVVRLISDMVNRNRYMGDTGRFFLKVERNSLEGIDHF